MVPRCKRAGWMPDSLIQEERDGVGLHDFRSLADCLSRYGRVKNQCAKAQSSGQSETTCRFVSIL
jgi:hypothetical protein